MPVRRTGVLPGLAGRLSRQSIASKRTRRECLVAQSYDTIIGLLFRDYSLRGNGQVDYRTARHIMGISFDDPVSEELDVARHPLFYWYDANQDGQWDLWIDRDEEGHLANAVRYDWGQGEDLITSSKTW